jgi:hypothetical protein
MNESKFPESINLHCRPTPTWGALGSEPEDEGISQVSSFERRIGID